MTVCDDRGRALSFTKPPRRIVSLVPSISETLWHLGAGSRLVGVTRYCTEPSELRAIACCGGTKNPDCAAILALRPDLIFMSEEENRREEFEYLVEAGQSVFVTYPKTIADVADWVRRVGVLLACEKFAEVLALDIDAALVAAQAHAHDRQALRVLCPVWKKPWMTFNRDTYADAVLRASGGLNIFADACERYCQFTLGEAAALQPDLVLLPDEPYPFSERHLADVNVLLHPSGSARAARVVDGRALSWYGARTPEGLRVFQNEIFGGSV